MPTVSVQFTHHFVEKTYHRWTFCDHCSKVLWGIVKQGVECMECGFICHKRCQDSLTFVCDHRLKFTDNHLLSEEVDMEDSKVDPTGLSFDTSTSTTVLGHSDTAGDSGVFSDSDISSSPSSTGLRSLPSLGKSSSHLSTSSNAASTYATVDATGRPSSAGRRSGRNKVYQEGESSSRSNHSIMQDLIVSTAANQMAMDRSVQAPALNLLTKTPKNFTRFVQRAGAMSAAEGAVLHIMNWQSPSATILCMVAYAMLCIYPSLLLLVPHLALLNIIISNYYSRAREVAAARAVHPRRSSNKRGQPSLQNLPSPSSSNATSVAQYKANMQFIQNFMGNFADGYDAVVAQLHHIDWSDPAHTASILQKLLAAIVAALIVVYWVPLSWLLLVGGELAFVANTAIVKAMADTLLPVALERLNVGIKRAQTMVEKRRQAFSQTKAKTA